jgi:hypothetical protein
MWNVPTTWLCRAHLLGEHLEMHMFAGALRQGKDLTGYIRGGLVELDAIEDRHKELVFEMQRRGYKHGTPLREVKLILPHGRDALLFLGNVDMWKNVYELMNRCATCRERIFELSGQ